MPPRESRKVPEAPPPAGAGDATRVESLSFLAITSLSGLLQACSLGHVLESWRCSM
jgi:hypothetical protein